MITESRYKRGVGLGGGGESIQEREHTKNKYTGQFKLVVESKLIVDLEAYTLRKKQTSEGH